MPVIPKAFPPERRRDVVAVAGKTEAPTAHIAKDLVQCRFRMKASLAGAALRNAAPAPLSRQDGGALGPRRFRFGSSSKRCAATDLVGSTGRAGWGDATAESFLAALKNDMYPRQPFPTRARARFAVADHIEVFYDPQCLHPTLGYRTPPRPCPGHRRPPRGVDQPGAPVQDPWHTPRRRQDGVGCVRACRRSMSVWRSSPGVRDRPPVPAIWPKISPSRRATNTGACAAGSGAPAATSIFTARS
ncbi:MAG: hypothetical protein K0R62_3047 [Nonomuraea muscovyensis]|nr:hypothetical protein [Nonomuraea muscovyensis]